MVYGKGAEGHLAATRDRRPMLLPLVAALLPQQVRLAAVLLPRPARPVVERLQQEVRQQPRLPQFSVAPEDGAAEAAGCS